MLMGVVAFVIVGYFVYANFLKSEPTCFDAKQNQGERGVDCGGVCALVCQADARVIVPLWSRVFETVPGVSSVVAYVENQNQSAGTHEIAYEFRVYDEDNILVAEPVTGTTFIAPNGRTAIFYSPVQTGNRMPKNVFFRFTSIPSWTRLGERFQTPQLTGTNTQLTDEENSPKLSADIVNSSFYDYSNIEIIAIVYGTDGNAINASRTFIESVPQQSTRTVFFSWPQKFDEKAARIEIIPRINPYAQAQQ